MEPSGTLPHPKFHSREKCSIRFSVMPLALLQSARSPLQSVCSCTWCAMNSLHLLPRAPSNCNAAIYLHQDCGPNWLGGIIQTNWACTRHGMARLTPSCSIPLKHEAFESEGEAELNQKRRHRRTEMCTAHENEQDGQDPFRISASDSTSVQIHQIPSNASNASWAYSYSCLFPFAEEMYDIWGNDNGDIAMATQQRSETEFSLSSSIQTCL